MARLDGKFLKGIVGNATLKKWRDQQIIQIKTHSPRQTEATKKSANLFGKASSLGKLIRQDLANVNCDGRMVNNLNFEDQKILSQCFDKETEQFIFHEQSFSNLEGFEFNAKSLLKNYLWVKPVLTITNDALLVTLPEIKIPEELNFPVNANLCVLRIKVGLIALKAGYRREMQYQDIDIELGQGIVPAQVWSFIIAQGCLCIASATLYYYKKEGNIQTAINTKQFSPSAIFGALYHPGDFVMPPQLNPKLIQIRWRTSGLQLS